MGHCDIIEIMKNSESNTASQEFLSRKDVEKMLGISRSQIDRYRNSGLLKAIQFVPKGRYKYRYTDVEKLLNGE